MTYREIATSMIEEGEGLILVVYDDATGRPLKQGDTIKGHPTIGWGRNLAGKGISEAEARALLVADLDDSEEAAKGFVGGVVWRALNDVRRAVLIDMAHNLGAAGLYRFAKLRGALERVNYEQAAREIEDSTYFRQVKTRGVRNRDAMRTGAWGNHGAERPEPAPEPEPAPAVPEVPDHPSRWPRSARRWVVRRQRHNLAGIEYWTNEYVGPQSECNPVVSLDPSKAERWIDEQAALASVRAYDDRMLGQGFVAHQLEEWGE